MTQGRPLFRDYFCIGGPLDGAMYRSDNRPYFTVPVLESMRMASPQEMERAVPTKNVIYTSTPMHVDGEVINFALADGITIRDAMNRLVNAYSEAAIKREIRKRNAEPCCTGFCDGACVR